VHQLLQIVAILVVLLIVLRISLRHKGKSFNLRGRITALNIATGSLAGLAAGMLLQGMIAVAAIDPDGPGGDVGYGVLGSALRSVMPFTGAAFGALGGYVLLGTLWRWIVRRNDARARTTILGIEIAVCIAALMVILRSLL
jgi:uncharacterized membrane protein